MTDWWLASYIVLWILILACIALILGLAREMALLRGTVPVSGETAPDDPPLGASLPNVDLPLISSGERVSLRSEDTEARLVIFLSPLCQGCQSAVHRINFVARSRECPSTLVVLAGSESTCRSFIDLFPIDVPVAVDAQRATSDIFGVHAAPYAVLYKDGVVVAKTFVARDTDLVGLITLASSPRLGRQNRRESAPAVPL